MLALHRRYADAISAVRRSLALRFALPKYYRSVLAAAVFIAGLTLVVGSFGSSVQPVQAGDRHHECPASKWKSGGEKDCKTKTPTVTPETPTSTPETPTSTPETPTSTPETPTSTPETPTSTPETPTSTPEDPTSTPDDPATPTTTTPTTTETPVTEVLAATEEPVAVVLALPASGSGGPAEAPLGLYAGLLLMLSGLLIATLGRLAASFRRSD